VKSLTEENIETIKTNISGTAMGAYRGQDVVLS
jgi:hypothetical protein